ncbi:MAG: PKD domain-containing protein, partial [Planctomycetota bacterium]
EELAVRYAVGETTIKGSVSGDIDGTERREDVYEQISEVLTNQGKKGYGILEHIWRFENVPTGEFVQLRIEAYRTISDSDNFVLSYSTNGSSYDPLGLNVTKDFDDNTENIIDLPAGTNNIIWVKVENTDRTKGNKNLDTLFVDCMYIVSSDEVIGTAEVVPPETGPGNLPPIANAGPDQTVTDSEGDGESVPLSGSASDDPDGDIVSYAWDIDNDGDTDETDPSIEPTFAVGSHTVTLTVTDNGGLSDSDQVLITVQAAGGGTTMYVVDMAGTRTLKGASGQWTAFVTLTVIEDNDPLKPVFGATVNGQWTGAASGTSSGITGSDGTVTLSSGNIKNGTTATFTVTGIEHDTLTYTPDPQDQVIVTR